MVGDTMSMMNNVMVQGSSAERGSKWSYCIDIPIKHVDIPAKYVEAFMKMFESGESIDRLTALLHALKATINVLEMVRGNKAVYYVDTAIDSPYYELANVICGLSYKVKHGKISGEPFIYFYPHEFWNKCEELKTILALTFVCVNISKNRKRCIEIAKRHIEQRLFRSIIYDVRIELGLHNTFIRVCIYVDASRVGGAK